MFGRQKFPLTFMVLPAGPSRTYLNMLRMSRINPKLSAHEQLHGIHDFNATPLAPPGTECIAHEKSRQCGTWAPHGQHGWYVGAAPEHYRCYQIYIPKTQGTRICDTVEFFPTVGTSRHKSNDMSSTTSGLRDVAQPTIGPYMPIEGDAIQHASSTHFHGPQDQRPTDRNIGGPREP